MPYNMSTRVVAVVAAVAAAADPPRVYAVCDEQEARPSGVPTLLPTVGPSPVLSEHAPFPYKIQV